MNEEKLNIKKDGFKKLDNNFFNIGEDIVNEFNTISNTKNFNNIGYKNTAIINKLENLKGFTQIENLYENIKTGGSS